MRFSILLAGSIFLCAIFVKPIAQDSFNSDQLVNLAFNGLETEKSNDQFLQDSANLGGFDNLTPTAKADETTDTDGIGSATPNQGETSIINSDYGGNSPPVSSNNEEYYISPAQPQDLADDPNKTPPTGSLDDGLLTGNSFHGHRPYFPLRNIYDSLHGFLQYFQLEPRPITPQKAICQGNRTPLCCYDGSDRWKNVYKQCYQCACHCFVAALFLGGFVTILPPVPSNPHL